MPDIITTLKNDANAIETFLEAEGAKIESFVAKAAPGVVTAFNNLVGEAKSEVSVLALGAEQATSGELSAIAADFETAIANAVQKMGNGQPGVVLTASAGATGLQQLATQAASLVLPLFVKVLAAAV